MSMREVELASLTSRDLSPRKRTAFTAHINSYIITGRINMFLIHPCMRPRIIAVSHEKHKEIRMGWSSKSLLKTFFDQVPSPT